MNNVEIKPVEGEPVIDPPTGIEFHEYEISYRHRVFVNGQRVPHLMAWVSDEDDDKENPRCSILLDGRMAIDGRLDEVKKWVYYMANAMAVAAGYTNHGPNARALNYFDR